MVTAPLSQTRPRASFPRYDTLDEAVANIAGFVGKAGPTDARTATVDVRSPGTPNGTPAAQEVEIDHVHPVLGLDDGQRDRLRHALGKGGKAPSMKVTFKFDVA